MIKELLYVGAGGCLGSVLRYLVSIAMKPCGNAFPWGTFIVNILGCLAIGAIAGFIDRTPSVSTETGLFLTVGLCGGFTTFSTFSKESLLLLQSGNYVGLSFYVAGSALLGLLAVWLGFSLLK